MKEKKDKYMAKILSATPAELVVINYELVIDCISSALENEDEEEQFQLYLNKAKNFLGELMKSLDMQHDIAKQLMSIYLYVNQQLIRGGITENEERRKALCAEAKEMMEVLLPGWQAVSQSKEGKEGEENHLFESVPKVYAGLTYNKKGQMEEFLDDGGHKGFKA